MWDEMSVHECAITSTTCKDATTDGVAVKSGVYCDDALCDVSMFRAHVPQTTAV